MDNSLAQILALPEVAQVAVSYSRDLDAIEVAVIGEDQGVALLCTPYSALRAAYAILMAVEEATAIKRAERRAEQALRAKRSTLQ